MGAHYTRNIQIFFNITSLINEEFKKKMVIFYSMLFYKLSKPIFGNKKENKRVDYLVHTKSRVNIQINVASYGIEWATVI